MRLKLAVGTQLLQVLVLSTGVLAQAAPLPELPPPPPANQAAPSPQATPAPEPAPAGDASCVPACRSGFMCQSGVCISACNPPCPSGQQCTAQGECAYPQQQPQYPGTAYPPPPPPSYPLPSYQPPPPIEPPPGSRMHDGFFLRAGLGFGYSAISQSSDNDTSLIEYDMTGFTIALNVDVGFSPVENFVLQARFGMSLLTDPRVTSDVDPDSDYPNFSINTLLVAPAATYYFMPINFYVTGAVGLVWLSFSSDTSDYDGYNRDISDTTDVGIGLNLDVGKEWWVGRQWGLGVAGRLGYAGVSGDVTAGRGYEYAAWSFCVLFSATLQ